MAKKIPLRELQKPFRTKECAVHGLSIRGISHEMSDMPMQDSFAALQLDNGWIVLAVADGVGSQPKSDIGAQKAVEAVVNHINSFRGYLIDDESIETMLYAAYQSACAELYEQAKKDQAPLREYSTTLHTVIFNDGLLYIMHAGDGGVAVITEDGDYRKLTVPMKDKDGESVIPLQAGPEAWQFITSSERAQSVIVATDGVWDKLCPSILEGYGYQPGIEKNIAAFFLSPWARDWENEDLDQVCGKEISVIRADMKDAVPEFYNTLVRAVAQEEDSAEAEILVKEKSASGNVPLKLLRNIKDDITALTLVRFNPLPGKTPVSLFSPPDWQAINQWANERLYSKNVRSIESNEPEVPAESTEPVEPEEQTEPETGNTSEEEL